MSSSLVTRARLKIKKIAKEMTESPAEREFHRIWPMIDSIEGWLLPSEGKWLFDTARSLPDHSSVVEIGSFKGRSTCCLALGCKGTAKRIFAIDSFDGGPNLPKADSLPNFKENLGRLALSRHVEPIASLSSEVAKTWNRPIHFLFVDGSHLYEDVLSDFTGFFHHVLPGGIVAFHDVSNESWPDVGMAWHGIIKCQLGEIGYCDGLGYGRKAGPDSQSVAPRPPNLT